MPFIRRGRPEGHKNFCWLLRTGEGGRRPEFARLAPLIFSHVRCAPQNYFSKMSTTKNAVQFQPTRRLIIFQFFKEIVARTSSFFVPLAPAGRPSTTIAKNRPPNTAIFPEGTFTAQLGQPLAQSDGFNTTLEMAAQWCFVNTVAV